MSSLLEQQIREQVRDHFRAKWSLWAAVGAGCLVGVSGVILMQRLSLRVDHSLCLGSGAVANSVSKELASLHSTLKELRQEILELKTKPPLRSALRTPTVTFEESTTQDVLDGRYMSRECDDDTASSSTDFVSLSSSGTSTATNYFSAISSDEEEEFFDVPSENTESITNSSAVNGIVPGHPGNVHVKPKNEAVLEEYLSHAEKLSMEIEKLKASEMSEEERNKRKEMVHLFESVDSYMEGQADLQKQAYRMLTEKDEPPLCENSEFLWRLCKSTYLMAITVGQEGDQERKQELIFRAVDHGHRAIESNDNSSEAHKVVCLVNTLLLIKFLFDSLNLTIFKEIDIMFYSFFSIHSGLLFLLAVEESTSVSKKKY